MSLTLKFKTPELLSTSFGKYKKELANDLDTFLAIPLSEKVPIHFFYLSEFEYTLGDDDDDDDDDEKGKGKGKNKVAPMLWIGDIPPLWKKVISQDFRKRKDFAYGTLAFDSKEGETSILALTILKGKGGKDLFIKEINKSLLRKIKSKSRCVLKIGSVQVAEGTDSEDTDLVDENDESVGQLLTEKGDQKGSTKGIFGRILLEEKYYYLCGSNYVQALEHLDNLDTLIDEWKIAFSKEERDEERKNQYEHIKALLGKIQNKAKEVKLLALKAQKDDDLNNLLEDWKYLKPQAEENIEMYEQAKGRKKKEAAKEPARFTYQELEAFVVVAEQWQTDNKSKDLKEQIGEAKALMVKIKEEVVHDVVPYEVNTDNYTPISQRNDKQIKQVLAECTVMSEEEAFVSPFMQSKQPEKLNDIYRFVFKQYQAYQDNIAKENVEAAQYHLYNMSENIVAWMTLYDKLDGITKNENKDAHDKLQELQKETYMAQKQLSSYSIDHDTYFEVVDEFQLLQAALKEVRKMSSGHVAQIATKDKTGAEMSTSEKRWWQFREKVELLESKIKTWQANHLHLSDPSVQERNGHLEELRKQMHKMAMEKNVKHVLINSEITTLQVYDPKKDKHLKTIAENVNPQNKYWYQLSILDTSNPFASGKSREFWEETYKKFTTLIKDLGPWREHRWLINATIESCSRLRAHHSEVQAAVNKWEYTAEAYADSPLLRQTQNYIDKVKDKLAEYETKLKAVEAFINKTESARKDFKEQRHSYKIHKGMLDEYGKMDVDTLSESQLVDYYNTLVGTETSKMAILGDGVYMHDYRFETKKDKEFISSISNKKSKEYVDTFKKRADILTKLTNHFQSKIDETDDQFKQIRKDYLDKKDEHPFTFVFDVDGQHDQDNAYTTTAQESRKKKLATIGQLSVRIQQFLGQMQHVALLRGQLEESAKNAKLMLKELDELTNKSDQTVGEWEHEKEILTVRPILNDIITQLTGTELKGKLDTLISEISRVQTFQEKLKFYRQEFFSNGSTDIPEEVSDIVNQLQKLFEKVKNDVDGFDANNSDAKMLRNCARIINSLAELDATISEWEDNHHFGRSEIVKLVKSNLKQVKQEWESKTNKEPFTTLSKNPKLLWFEAMENVYKNLKTQCDEEFEVLEKVIDEHQKQPNSTTELLVYLSNNVKKRLDKIKQEEAQVKSTISQDYIQLFKDHSGEDDNFWEEHRQNLSDAVDTLTTSNKELNIIRIDIEKAIIKGQRTAHAKAFAGIPPYCTINDLEKLGIAPDSEERKAIDAILEEVAKRYAPLKKMIDDAMMVNPTQALVYFEQARELYEHIPVNFWPAEVREDTRLFYMVDKTFDKLGQQQAQEIADKTKQDSRNLTNTIDKWEKTDALNKLTDVNDLVQLLFSDYDTGKKTSDDSKIKSFVIDSFNTNTTDKEGNTVRTSKGTDAEKWSTGLDALGKSLDMGKDILTIIKESNNPKKRKMILTFAGLIGKAVALGGSLADNDVVKKLSGEYGNLLKYFTTLIELTDSPEYKETITKAQIHEKNIDLIQKCIEATIELCGSTVTTLEIFAEASATVGACFGIALDLVKIGFLARKIHKERMKKKVDIGLMRDAASKEQTILAKAIRQNKNRRNEKLAEMGVELGVTILDVGVQVAAIGAAYGNPAAATGAKAVMKLVGGAIKFGAKVIFTGITIKKAHDAKKMLLLAKAGDPVAQKEVFTKHAQYAKMAITLSAVGLCGDSGKIAQQYCINAGLYTNPHITEKEIDDDLESNQSANLEIIKSTYNFLLEESGETGTDVNPFTQFKNALSQWWTTTKTDIVLFWGGKRDYKTIRDVYGAGLIKEMVMEYLSYKDRKLKRDHHQKLESIYQSLTEAKTHVEEAIQNAEKLLQGQDAGSEKGEEVLLDDARFQQIQQNLEILYPDLGFINDIADIIPVALKD